MTREEIYDEGWDAFNASIVHCPYLENTELEKYDDWWDGWYDAQAEFTRNYR